MAAIFDTLLAESITPMLDYQFGEPVTLQRGTKTTAGVTASWLAQEAEAVDQDGLTTAFADRVWLVLKIDYAFSGVAVEPRPGDLITTDEGSWEVLPTAGKKAAESYAAGTQWAIRTKQVSGG